MVCPNCNSPQNDAFLLWTNPPQQEGIAPGVIRYTTKFWCPECGYEEEITEDIVIDPAELTE